MIVKHGVFVCGGFRVDEHADDLPVILSGNVPLMFILNTAT